MKEVGHCKECCIRMWHIAGLEHLCDPIDPNIEHLPKEKCPFCQESEGVVH